MRRPLCFFGLFLCCIRLASGAAQDGGAVAGTPFHRYSTADSLGRSITFYLSGRSPGRTAPLAVWVQGTGCESLFGSEGGRITMRAHALLREAAAGRALVLAVEKPGVRFLDQQADAADAKTCRPEFLREHTLERWAAAIVAAIGAARELPGVDRSRTLVIGGSEGGVVAVRVSRTSPAVTHAASLAGGGANHLFVLADYVRRQGLDAEKEVYGCWAQILQDPDSATRFCWGQPYRLWSSLLKTSLTQECLESRAALYLVHGTADEQSAVAGFDVLRAELAARGRRAMFERIEGADHALRVPGQDPAEGLLAVYRRILDWFVQ